ncbi:MAG: RNA-binding protein [Methanosphaera sp. rholeuAM270]|nr:MAG: RNA-binding protein [Methanosphaera sp. rholeuAM270]
MKIKKRNFLKNKKIKEIKNELGNYQYILPKKAQVELVKIEDLPDILLIDGKPLLMQIDNKTIPTLHAVVNEEITEKYATVDMGAINFVIKGADIMSPGIVDADKSIAPGETIVIIEEKHHKPLAIGTSLISGEEMIENNRGKAIENLHYVGDPIWELNI